MARLEFALRMILARFDRRRSLCPYCACSLSVFVRRKKFFIEARKCLSCDLVYRWPIDNPTEAKYFYEHAYKGQQATEMPDREALKGLTGKEFKDTKWDKGHRLDFMRSLIQCQGKLLDFGCAWGYGAYQYERLGFKVAGLEVDKKRADFGRSNLGQDIYTDWEELKNSYFDVIIADHVLEHLCNLRETLHEFRLHSKPGSILIIFVPNGSRRPTKFTGREWQWFIGESHQVLFTMEWFLKNLPDHCFYPEFFTHSAKPISENECFSDEEEIALIARRVEG